MKLSSALLLLFSLADVVAQQSSTTDSNNATSATESEVVFQGCDATAYYASLPAESMQWTKQQVQDLLVATHMNKLPSLGRKDEANILTALVDLDQGAEEGTVHLYMRDIDFDAKQQNTPEGWKRGDLWPIARGAGIDTAAGTDVHTKRPEDWEVDTALFSLFWGECGTVESKDRCMVPAVPNQTAPSTAQDLKIKTPPESMRGQVARSVLYAALRYGTELNLTLTDCPPFPTNEYGYLSELLSWHAAFPVTAEEMERNERACSRWQGNRNPLVDFPELATQFFGLPDTVLEGTFTYSKCMETLMTNSPTATPNECSALSPGDVHVLIFNSDPVDQMVFFPVSDVAESVGSIFVTDQAWNGTDFVTDEGTLEYSIPAGGITAGNVFGYGVQFPKDTGTWEIVDQSFFDLSTTQPDNIFVYCLNADGQPHFLQALTTNSDGFQEAGLAKYEYSETSLPAGLSESGSLVLPFAPSYLYEGIREGDKAELIAAFEDPANYKASNTPYNIVTSAVASTTTTTIRVLAQSAVAALVATAVSAWV